MRVFLVSAIVLLAGCAEPSVAEQQLQAACAAGDTRACEVVLAAEDRRREALSAALLSYGSQPPQPVYQPYVMQPTLTVPSQTNCYAIGNMLNCTTY
jgi:hypothetical protein